MPVYLRKNVSYTPPSIDKLPQESEDDFVNDPDLLKDTLPQPFRMIDKTLTDLLDETWEIIAKREEERLEEARKVRPPQYEPAIKLDEPVPGSQKPEKQTVATTVSMCESSDGNFIFMGLQCGLTVLDCMTQQFLGSWEDDKAEITYIRAYTLSPSAHLLVTIDDMGIGRLFAFTNNKVFLIRILNSNPQDSDNKTLISKLEASSEGDYLGTVMENPASGDVWLEVHKMPKDAWLNDLDVAIAAIKKKEEKNQEMLEADTESVVASEVAASQIDATEPSIASGHSGAAPLDTADTSQGKRQLRVSFTSSFDKGRSPRMHKLPKHAVVHGRGKNVESRPVSASSAVDLGEPSGELIEPEVKVPSSKKDPLSGDYKFAAPSLVMKVKRPNPVTGVSVSNLQTTLQKVDSADVVGLGHNTIFTPAHLDTRQSMFNHLHDNLLSYLPDGEQADKLVQYPNFHFMTAGRMLPQGLEQQSLEGRPTTLAVWWPGTSNLVQYSLLKSSKDIEFKPDLVWPFSTRITCSEVSPDTNIIAIGLENGSVVVWDKYMGTQRGVINIRDDSAIMKMKFLNPCMHPQDTDNGSPYQTGCATYMLVMCANSALYSVSTGPGLSLQAGLLSLPVENDDDTVTLLKPFVSHQDMLLTVTRSGKVEIRDTLKGNILCQIALPHDCELLSPWEPIYALGGQGQMLFVKGVPKVQDDSEAVDTDSTTQKGFVFVYKLKFFPSLDAHWALERTNLPFTVHTTINDRVDAVFTQRVSQQITRKARMQERWSQMKSEIANIDKMKDEARQKAETRNIMTPGSVGLSLGQLNYAFKI